MALTDSYYDIAKHFQASFESPAAASLGLQDVFYGDQNKIGRTPTLCIEPGDTSWELNGIPRRALAQITIYFLLYHSTIASAEENREANDLLTKSVIAFINQDVDLGGLVVHGLVVDAESGYSQKGNSFFRATRIAYRGTSQVQLPSTA